MKELTLEERIESLEALVERLRERILDLEEDVYACE